MPLFKYTKVCFCVNPEISGSESIPVGIIAEWHDGEFWKIALCASKKLRSQDFNKLDTASKTFLNDPFSLLYHTIDKYIKDHGWHQVEHTLGHFITRVFSSQTTLHVEFLFEQAVAPGDNPEVIFSELSECIPGITNKSFWHRINPEEVTSVDNTRVLE